VTAHPRTLFAPSICNVVDYAKQRTESLNASLNGLDTCARQSLCPQPAVRRRSISESNSVKRGQRRRSRPALADSVGQNKVEIWLSLAADHGISILTTSDFSLPSSNPPIRPLHRFVRVLRVLWWSWYSSVCFWRCAASVRMGEIATRPARQSTMHK
jgi:hypothetical protein